MVRVDGVLLDDENNITTKSRAELKCAEAVTNSNKLHLYVMTYLPTCAHIFRRCHMQIYLHTSHTIIIQRTSPTTHLPTMPYANLLTYICIPSSFNEHLPLHIF